MARSAIRVICAFLAVCAAFSAAVSAKTVHVVDKAAYDAAVPLLAPGDVLELGNGVWRDVQLIFSAKGTAAQPITLQAETPGRVILSGQSNLAIGGQHLVVKNLVFRDGYSPTKAVIAFRQDSKALAHHVRLTGVVIDQFNKPSRTDQDSWVVLYGQHNRVDHSHFEGKTNKGPTLVVRLNSAESQNNQHLIDHNYFGPRPPLGGNGGETVRIGTSQYSRTASKSILRQNIFDRCNGEVEIISIKSEYNLISENMFLQSKGAVVFRHGGHNTVSRNIFLGDGVADTGGVRVINNHQTVTDNYFEGLRGQKFQSALTIMNGVPKSPINRYHQVENARVSGNSFIDITTVGLAVGQDAERSAAPKDSQIVDNLFLFANARDGAEVFDDLSGIAFRNRVNVQDSLLIGAGTWTDPTLTRAANGLLYPDSDFGAPRDLKPVERADTGVAWYEKPALTPPAPHEMGVPASSGSLEKALLEAADGAVLSLAPGRYDLRAPLVIDKTITLRPQKPGSAPLIIANSASAIALKAGAVLTVEGLTFTGLNGVHPIIRAVGKTYRGAYRLTLQDVDFISTDTDFTGAVLAADSQSFASSVHLLGVTATDWQGDIIALPGQGLEGWYLADDIVIQDSRFNDVNGLIIGFSREGRDESTFGPRVEFTRNLVRAGASPMMSLDGIDGLNLHQNDFHHAGLIRVSQRVLGYPFKASGNRYHKTPAPEIWSRDGVRIKAQSYRQSPPYKHVGAAP